jgi:hypothetical protein
MGPPGEPHLDTWPAEVLYRVMSFATWRIRGAVFPLLSHQCLALSRQPAHWEFLARWLAEETLLFVPDARGFVGRDVFMDLWQSRHLFVGDVAAAEPEASPPPPSPSKVSLTVCCRFRPSVSTAGGDEPEGSSTKVVVPLHQRVQQVR